MTKIIKKFHAATDVDPHAEIYYVDPTDITQQFLGSPNEGLISGSEYIKFFGYLRQQTNQPMIADGQSGFGNPLNAYFTVKEFEYYGADIITINDQIFPSSTNQPKAADKYDFAGRIKAAIDAHQVASSEIWAKFDCFEEYGEAGLMKRFQMAEQLGIDGAIFNRIPTDTINKITSSIKIATMNGDQAGQYHFE